MSDEVKEEKILLGQDSEGEDIFMGDYARIDDYMVRFIGEKNVYFNETLNDEELGVRMQELEAAHPGLDYHHFTKITPEEAGAV